MPDLGPPQGERGTRSLWRRLADLLPVAAVLLPLGMLMGAAWVSWRSVWEDAAAEMSRLADAGAEYNARTLEAYAVAAGRVNDRLRGLSDAEITAQEATLHEELRRLLRDVRTSDVSYVIDREGFPLLSTVVYPVPRTISVRDRDYFRGVSGPDAPEVYVSEVVLARLDPGLYFAVSRARRDPALPPNSAAGFLGLSTFSVDPNQQAEGMRRLLGHPDDTLALTREDGQILSRTAGQVGPLPPVPAGTAFRRIAASGARRAVYQGNASVDGTPSLIALRRLDGFPIYAVAFRPRAAIMARWRGLIASHLIFGVPATLALLLLSLSVRRQQRALGVANAFLARDVERSAGRLRRAMRIARVGTFEYDLATGRNLRSPEYMALQGLPARPTEETHADWVRRLHPEDRDRAAAHLLASLADGNPVTEYAQDYRIIWPSGEIRWIAARASILRDTHGRALRMLGAHVDVTSLKATEQALLDSDARLRLAQDAVGIGTWEWLPATRQLRWSARMIELWGFDPAAGQPDFPAAMARFHPADRLRVRHELAQAHRDGRFRTEFRLIRPRAGAAGPGGAETGADTVTETIWVAARARLLPLPGQPDRLLGVAYDITERKLADERAALLSREVEHRAKNALAIVSGMLRMTAAESLEQFVEAVQARVDSLARTLGLMARQRWQGASLRAVAEEELRPFRNAAAETGVTPDTAPPGGPSILLDGPEVHLPADAVQPLSMALHELATNAAKYGALSVPEGRLLLRWTQAGDTVSLVWQERGGPPVAGPPARLSFGSEVIRQTVENQLAGRLQKTWEPEGLVCEISFALPAAADAP